MKQFVVSVLCMAIVCATGCATNPKKIDAAYVSPLKYKDYDCDQIAAEMDHIGRRTNELFHSLKKASNNDKWQMGVGMILLWPVLFALEGGDGPEAAEYARLKGEYEALRQMAIEKKCNMECLSPSPDELLKAEKNKSKKAQKAESEMKEAPSEATAPAEATQQINN